MSFPIASRADRHVVLLRGINVGGHRKVKMAELREQLADAGFEGVATYIQTGNIAVTSPASTSEVQARVERLFEERYEFVPRCMALSAAALEDAVAACPFAEEAAEDPKTVHAYFLAAAPAEEAIAALAAQDVAPDEWRIPSPPGDVLYLHAPDGLGRSNAADLIERRLKVPATARNWRSTLKLLELAGAEEG